MSELSNARGTIFCLREEIQRWQDALVAADTEVARLQAEVAGYEDRGMGKLKGYQVLAVGVLETCSRDLHAEDGTLVDLGAYDEHLLAVLAPAGAVDPKPGSTCTVCGLGWDDHDPECPMLIKEKSDE